MTGIEDELLAGRCSQGRTFPACYKLSNEATWTAVAPRATMRTMTKAHVRRARMMARKNGAKRFLHLAYPILEAAHGLTTIGLQRKYYIHLLRCARDSLRGFCSRLVKLGSNVSARRQGTEIH